MDVGNHNETEAGLAPVSVTPGVAVEGAADFFFCRPLGENPYMRACDGWGSWRWGWLEAQWFEQARGWRERRRWTP